MGQYLSNPRKTNLRVKLNPIAYRKLVATAESAVAALTGNSNFTTPEPSLATITTAASDLRAAMAPLGIRRNRSGKAEVTACRDKAVYLNQLLQSLKLYCQNTAQANTGEDTIAAKAQLATTGMSLALAPKKTADTVGIPRNLHQSNSKKYPYTLHRISWQRPIGLIKGKKLTAYVIKDVGGALIEQTTKTNAIIPIQSLGGTRVVVVYGLSAAGLGDGQQIRVR